MFETFLNHTNGLINLMTSVGVAILTVLGFGKLTFTDKDTYNRDKKEFMLLINGVKDDILKQTVTKDSLLCVTKVQEEQGKQLTELRRSIDLLLSKFEESKDHRAEANEAIKGLRHDIETQLVDLKTDLRAALAEVKEKQDTLAEANLEIRLQLQENKTKIEDYIGGGMHHEK